MRERTTTDAFNIGWKPLSIKATFRQKIWRIGREVEGNRWICLRDFDPTTQGEKSEGEAGMQVLLLFENGFAEPAEGAGNQIQFPGT